MSKTNFDELTIQKTLHQAEMQVDGQTSSRLAQIRSAALSEENHWFAEFRNLFSAGLVTAALLGVIVLPMGERLLSGENLDLQSEDSVTLLMEDPEFFLWLNESGVLVAER